MKVALYYRYIDDEDRLAYDTLVGALHTRGISTSEVHDGDAVVDCDYLFSIGGDGTLLSSVQFVRASAPEAFPPIVGINFGHLGFLTTVGRDGLQEMVDCLLNGRFSVEERTLLEVNDGVFALNEVFLHRPEDSSMLRTELYVDNRFVATYAGDGLIVATPTGSTAYSLSCGGPILTPDCGCFVVTPIGAHTLTLRPIIISDSACLRLVVVPATHHTGNTPVDEPITLGMDSRRATLYGPATVTIRRAPFKVRLVRIGEQDFFTAIREKLMWGTEVRN